MTAFYDPPSPTSSLASTRHPGYDSDLDEVIGQYHLKISNNRGDTNCHLVSLSPKSPHATDAADSGYITAANSAHNMDDIFEPPWSPCSMASTRAPDFDSEDDLPIGECQCTNTSSFLHTNCCSVPPNSPFPGSSVSSLASDSGSVADNSSFACSTPSRHAGANDSHTEYDDEDGLLERALRTDRLHKPKVLSRAKELDLDVHLPLVDLIRMTDCFPVLYKPVSPFLLMRPIFPQKTEAEKSFHIEDDNAEDSGNEEDINEPVSGTKNGMITIQRKHDDSEDNLGGPFSHSPRQKVVVRVTKKARHSYN